MELLVVGLDGLSYNMLEEFDVATPFLDDVRSGGISGDLKSVDTPTTLPAWTSFATGQDPGSHGVATMLDQSSDYIISPATVITAVPAVYDLLNDAMFVNLPGSAGRVPTAERTHLVSSILSAGPADAVPEPLQRLDSFDEYIVHDEGSMKSDPESYVDHLHEVTCARRDFAAEAFDWADPRVGFVLFSTPDWVGHFLQFAADDATRQRWYRSVVERVDECAAAVAERTAAENVVLMSDHGFQHKPNAVHLQSWLEREGYLVKEVHQQPLQRAATSAAKQVARHAGPLFDVLRTAYLRYIADGDADLGDVVDFNPDVDFSSSTAWHLRYGCLYFNDDRFDDPTVDEEESETVRQELRDRLRALTDDEGNRVFASVGFPEDVYTNPDPDVQLPDVIARPASGYLPLRAFSPTGDPVIATPGHDHYDHRYRGLIAAEGPLFRSGTVEGMSIVDVVPTLLHALGEPRHPEFDGHVRDDLLTTEDEPTVLAPDELPAPQTQESAGEDRETAAREQLRDLGYLE